MSEQENEQEERKVVDFRIGHCASFDGYNSFPAFVDGRNKQIDDLTEKLKAAEELNASYELEVAKNRSRVEELEGALKSVEWGNRRYTDMCSPADRCPLCLGRRSKGHHRTCRLDKALSTPSPTVVEQPKDTAEKLLHRVLEWGLSEPHDPAMDAVKNKLRCDIDGFLQGRIVETPKPTKRYTDEELARIAFKERLRSYGLEELHWSEKEQLLREVKVVAATVRTEFSAPAKEVALSSSPASPRAKEKICYHDHLDEEGYCRNCGTDCRGIHGPTILPSKEPSITDLERWVVEASPKMCLFMKSIINAGFSKIVVGEETDTFINAVDALLAAKAAQTGGAK